VPKHDIFVSAFNSSSRVQSVFEKTPAHRKIWLLHPEYQYSANDFPNDGEIVAPHSNDERIQVDELLKAIEPLDELTLCIDITGFMRHVLIFMIAKLAMSGVRKFTALYSEPESYSKQEATEFSTRTSGVVRPIHGMRANNNDNAQDALLLGIGFDHKLINEVINNKDHVVVYPILGFPPLSPDMFQQSAIRAAQSGGPALEDAWISNRITDCP